jgi:hypothetical protein
MPKAQAPSPCWLTQGQAQRLKIQAALPGSINDLMRKTGYTKHSIDHHLAKMKADGVVAKAYTWRAPGDHRKMAIYGIVGNLPKRPEASKPKPQPKPRKVFEISSPFRTIWIGGNPYSDKLSNARC